MGVRVRLATAIGVAICLCAPLGALAADLGDTETQYVLQAFLAGMPDALDAGYAVLTARDTRFVPVFIELLRANRIGIVYGAGPDNHAAALRELTGQDLGTDPWAWTEWHDNNRYEPPRGFTGWKGALYAAIDPNFAGFLREGVASKIHVEEIEWGGVLKDGIPALDHSPVVTAERAKHMADDEPVYGLEINGEARAYPVRILDPHEMANDILGGAPVSLSYCTLCNAAIAYDGRAGGTTQTFGSSGFLYRSNKLMYDRATWTLWNQFTGEAVLGPLASRMLRLDRFPLVMTTWSDWRRLHPETTVLAEETGHDRNYAPGFTYGHYFSSPRKMFAVSKRNDILPDKTLVYGIQLGGASKAYPLKTLVTNGVTNDTVGSKKVVLVAGSGVIRVHGSSAVAGRADYEMGAPVRAYSGASVQFTASGEPDTINDEQGNAWRVQEDALVGPGGKKAPRVDGHLAYWFGWYAFHPETRLY